MAAVGIKAGMFRAWGLYRLCPEPTVIWREGLVCALKTGQSDVYSGRGGGIFSVSCKRPAVAELACTGKITSDFIKDWAFEWCIKEKVAFPWKRGHLGA